MTRNAFSSAAVITAPASLFNEREAARRLGISPRTLWTMRHEGLISFVKLRGAVRYSESDLQAFIERQRQTAV